MREGRLTQQKLLHFGLNNEWEWLMGGESEL
jgi:hypothetical protein